ncbi:DNA recombination protein RmuC [Abyssibius alkaniclasticus]|uniref:DNA recombination protein RmuC n=1 Tax=Abyssibius alkaniclasticus TaxID=2881234 RepID=UPI002364A388|nr:DNA recombination protein RmuC [Abyssibius alkaniclasticus]UPH71868.1 DNA recombination protein RmuC [Abyssibius alkaniclasticus]
MNISDLNFEDPLILAAAIGLGFLVLLVLLLLMALRTGTRSARAIDPLARHVEGLSTSVRDLSFGQERLAGGVKSVSETQAAAQSSMLKVMEQRLADVQQAMHENLVNNAQRTNRTIAELQEKMNESLLGNTEKTTKSLTELQERLQTIDRAQTNIEKLSGDVLGLQDILSNKQTRGAFGEIQLNDIVSKALSPEGYSFQETLSNGKRADCLIHLPNPPGPIAIDSKFPLESYEALRAAAGDKAQTAEAARQFRNDVKAHIRAISEKYIIEGETADGALMFLPSEAVYAELHANFPDIVRDGFERRVWIVSPTTCMATLNTMRAVMKDAKMREHAHEIRRELGMLQGDLNRLDDRVAKLDGHFKMARRDVDDIKISASKANKRAHKLEKMEFDGDEVEAIAPPVPIAHSSEPTHPQVRLAAAMLREADPD